MQWDILIIPLIAVAVWILGSLFRNGEDERLKRARQGGEDVARPRPQRRPANDLDRFLEEARRRREQEERQAQQVERSGGESLSERQARTAARSPREPGTRPERRPVRPRQPVPLSEQPAPPPPRRLADLPAPTTPPTPLVRTIQEAPAPLAIAAPLPFAQPLELGTPINTSTMSARPAAVAAVVAPLARSPALTQVAALLRDPRSLGAVFVLREVLDRPLCERRR